MPRAAPGPTGACNLQVQKGNLMQSGDDDRLGRVQGYVDLSNSIRHYANLQFAQLPVFIAISGGILALLKGEGLFKPIWLRFCLEIGGVLIGLFFLAMSRRVSDYWDHRVAQAKRLEQTLAVSQYSEPPPKKRLCNNRRAVAGVYWVVTCFFGILAVRHAICFCLDCAG